MKRYNLMDVLCVIGAIVVYAGIGVLLALGV